MPESRSRPAAGRRPLRILGVLDAPFPIQGGAAITSLRLLDTLKGRHGHHVSVVGSAPVAGRRRHGGLEVQAYRDPDELKSILRRVRPDVVLSSRLAGRDVLPLTDRFGIPHVHLIHDFLYTPPTDRQVEQWGVRGRALLSRPEARRLLARFDRVLVASRFLQRLIHARHRISSRVTYPMFDPRATVLPPEARRPRGAVAGICGYRHKGAHIFLELARRFPRQPFLLVGQVTPRYRAEARRLPNVQLLPFGPTRRFLARSAIVLVPSQWPEPFGRIAVEAMANGVPSLVSLTGGLREIVGEGLAGVARFRQIDAWTARLDELLASESRRRANGRDGLRRAARFLGTASADVTARVLGVAASARHSSGWTEPIVALDGPTHLPTAFSLVNRQWAALLSQGAGRRGLTGQTADGPRTSVDLTIHHDLTAEFGGLAPPDEGAWVVQRIWDFGPFPPAWADKIRDTCDGLWVPTRWTRHQAVAAGVPPSRVMVVPHGIDPRIYRPAGPVRPLPTCKTFRFLFVGAPVLRKGLDILLRAYASAFRRSDDVCLVIKANPKDPVYRGEDLRGAVHQLIAQPDAPEVLLIDRYVPEGELAALYRSCDVGVFPYRAESFAIPILEAMACGVPAVVPRFGACLDFCSPSTSFFVPIRRIAIPTARTFVINSLEMREHVEDVDFCEVEADALCRALQQVRGLSPARIEARAARGVAVARGRFTWERCAEILSREVDRVLARGTPVRVRARRRALAAHRKQFRVARDLYLGR